MNFENKNFVHFFQKNLKNKEGITIWALYVKYMTLGV
jgi:hypothetical protein